MTCGSFADLILEVRQGDAGAISRCRKVSGAPRRSSFVPVLAALVIAVVGSWSGAALAESDDLIATNRFSGATVGFDLGGDYRNVTLTITGPNGFSVSARSERTAPVINLRKFGEVEDGRYNYQLTAATSKRIVVHASLDNGRGDAARTERYAGVAASGSFLVKGGVIFQPTEQEER
ncbi:hypothetical protein C8N35_11261 [Breoghania corrubedonensis]|uniref:Uncharacterized protein n=1 Tax=Breoghania corrubedonensis TaxID=665038 RepID=A0A2T5UW50_9HYPH|nr:hypothetical protein [Breoghania corrubedonensis]PTW55736.1 hypothetical protein C8N35_11261 [Breoghania corrubedonensis]